MKTLPIVDILRLALDDSAEPEYDVCDVSISNLFNLSHDWSRCWSWSDVLSEPTFSTRSETALVLNSFLLEFDSRPPSEGTRARTLPAV